MHIRVLIADDHPVFLVGLKGVIRINAEKEGDIAVVGEVANGAELLHAVREFIPDVLLLDINMPPHDVLEQVRRIRALPEQPRILILTATDDEQHVTSLLAAGVAGYMLKDEAPDMIVQAIRAVAQGETWFSQRIAGRVIRATRMPEADPESGGDIPITARESDILRLIACGKTNGEIAEQLVLSKATVQNHVSNIYTKLNIQGRSQAVLYALRHNMVTIEQIFD
jgi:DNA-binding NarL/FixJ family response regulator